MLPSILAKQLQKGIGDYIETTFPMTNEPFKGSVEKILNYAEEIFGEPFDKDAIIIEDRLSAQEFFAGAEVTEFTLPTVEQAIELEKLSEEDEPSAYLQSAVKDWLPNFSFDVLDDEGRIQLGYELMHHSFMQSVINLTGGTYYQVSKIAEDLAVHYPDLKTLPDADVVINSLFALISHARTGKVGKLRPFLNVQVQLWMRELRRLVAKVDSDEITYEIAHDLNKQQAKQYLPVVNCRDCGITGWVSVLNERSNATMTNLESFYCKQLLVDVDEDHDISSAYRMDNEEFPFGYEFVRKATLREINFGESDMTGEKLSVSGVEEVRKGFRICKYCGKIQPENGKANHSFACKTRKMPTLMQADAYEECLFLYREFSTEILRLLVPATTMDSSSVKMESFVAAFMLGMKEYFGNVDHLRATVSEVPVPDADYRKQYLVIYDSVPGGTGYLKQLMHEKNALIEIFEKALHVMENCSCKDDPQKDGCYHCLYAYRQSQQIGNISRTTAIRILKSILSGKDNVQKIDKINDIPVNPLFDSELEQRFMEAIRTKVGAANVSDTIRNGKHSYYVKIENFAWEIEPQVLLDAGSGVSVDCKPDFVFWPVSAPVHKPVAVFTDGFLYHKDIVSDDTIKREAIRRSGNFRVWSLSFKDVQSVFAPQGDFYTTTLEAEKMPSGKTMYQNMIKKQNADVIEPAKLSSFDLLLEYLKLPDAERVFKGQAYAYSLSLLEPALMKNNLAFNNWETIVKAVNDQTHFTNANFVFPGIIFGSWIPRTSNAHLAIHSAILASELKAEGAVAVCAVLNDEKDRRTDKYEQEWNGLWRFYNVMQFSDEFIAVSSVGMSHMDYLALPVAINADSDIVAPVAAVDDAWNAIKELLFDDDAKAFVEIAKDAGVPAPDEDNIGYEVEGDDGEVVATVEIAWPDRRIGFMTAEQAEDKEKLEKLGWRILNLLDAANMDVASYFGGDNQ